MATNGDGASGYEQTFTMGLFPVQKKETCTVFSYLITFYLSELILQLKINSENVSTELDSLPKTCSLKAWHQRQSFYGKKKIKSSLQGSLFSTF